MTRLSGFLASCGGFLLCVLITDLKYDLLVLPGSNLDAGLAETKTYYNTIFNLGPRRVFHVPLAMFLAVAGSIYKAYMVRRPMSYTQLGIMMFCGLTATFRTVPSAKAVIFPGVSEDEALFHARLVLFDHVILSILMVVFTALQIWDMNQVVVATNFKPVVTLTNNSTKKVK